MSVSMSSGREHSRRLPRIVLAVTSTQSIVLMEGLPTFLTDHGWDVHVVSSGSPSAVVGDSSAEFHSIRMRRNPAPASDLISLMRWVRLLRRLRPSAVVAGTPKAGLLGMIAAWLTRVPTRIYMLRGLRLETETGAKRLVLGMVERLTGRVATRIVAVSHSLRSEFLGLGLAKPAKVVVLGAGSSNGVEPPPKTEIALGRKELGLCEKTPVIGFVGRASHDKGIDLLANAVSSLRNEGLDVQVLLIGAEEPAGYLAQFGAKWAVAVGQVNNPGPYYGLMDMLCLPTRREGFPNVVLEAAVRGLPAIVSNATGAVDSVVDGVTGLIVQKESTRDLAVAIRSLCQNESIRREMGSRAQERATTEFARVLVHQRTEEFFRTVLVREQAAGAGREAGASVRRSVDNG